MKFGQLIKYNIRNIFVEKSCTKFGGEAIARLFPKKLKVKISQDLKFCTVCFYSMPS